MAEDLVGSYGYFGICVVLALEGTLGVGLFVPGLTVLCLAGYLAGSGTLDIAGVAPAAWLGIAIGDNLGYALGRFGMVRSPRALRAVDAVHARLDLRRPRWWWAFFHFPVITRAAFPVVLGASRFPVRKWIVLSALGSSLFASAFLAIGYAAGRAAGNLDSAQAQSTRLQQAFLVVLVAVVLAGLYRLWRHRRSKSK